MSADLLQYTPQEVINLFQALERLEEADIVQQKVGVELAHKAKISMETIALLRVRTITGGEVSDTEQQSLNEAGKLLKDILVSEIGKIPQENYPEYLLRVFEVIQNLEGLEVAQVIDKQIEEHAGISWSNLALRRLDIKEGKQLSQQEQDRVTAAGIYIRSVLNSLLNLS